MASTTDDEKRKPKVGGRIGGYVLTGLLVLGLGGFGASNFGTTVSAIGWVGDVRISTDDYARGLQTEARQLTQQYGMSLGTQELINMGFGDKVIRDLIAQATLDDQARVMGVSVGDETVAAELQKQNAFIGASGTFDINVYRNTLQQSGWSVSTYEEMLRASVGRTLLQGAVAGGHDVPAALVDKIFAFQAETRSFALLELVQSDLAAPLAEITEEELKAWYEANIDRFTLPEAKRIKYAALLPEAEAAKYPVDEAELRRVYDNRISEYIVAERRLVERLIYPDEASRDEALSSGKSFEELVTQRGLTLEAVDMGDVDQTALGAAGEPIFAANQGDLVAADSDLGPAIYRVNGILEGHSTSFEEAKDELAVDLMQDAARRAIADQVDDIDDALAGGESIDGLANLMSMQSGVVDYIPSRASDDVIVGYAAFRTEADKIKAGDFAQAILLDDGGVVAMEFVETVPASPIPFDQAREDVREAMQSERLAQAYLARAEEMKAAIEAGAPISTQGVTSNIRNFTRDRSLAKAPQTFASDLFAMKEGEVKIVQSGDYVALVQLTTIHAADAEGEEAQANREALTAALRNSIAQDAVESFLAATGQKAGISLDQNAINLVNTSLQ